MDIVAFDPGGKTGYARLKDDLLTWDIKDFSQLHTFECWTVNSSETEIIYEQPYGQQQFVKNIVYEAAGGIKTLAALYGLEIIGQRADVPKFIRARFFDGIEPRFGIHAREAVYHIIFRLHTQKLMSSEEIERIVETCQGYMSQTGRHSNAVDENGSIRVLNT